MFDWIGKLLNGINDWDLTWVGFRAFRPAQDQDMTARVVLALSIVYCPLAAAVAYLITLFTIGRQAPSQLPWVMGAAAALTFILLQSLLALVWNRRAAQLRAAKVRKPPAP